MELPSSLRKLSLDDNAYYTRPFLSSFIIPADVDLKIVRLRDYRDLCDFHPDDMFRAPSVTDALPTDTSTLPIIKDSTSLEVRHYSHNTYSLRGTTRAGHTVRVAAQLPEGWDREYDGELNSFNDLVAVFGAASVNTLFLNGNSGTVIDEEDWEAALSAWPGLETITIAHTDSLTRFDARLSLLDALLPPELEEGEAMKDAISAPWLKTLTVTSTTLSREGNEVAEALADCLRARKDAGFPLHRLRIRLEYISRPELEHEVVEDNAARARVYSEALTELVEHLQLDLLNVFYPENYVLYDDD